MKNLITKTIILVALLINVDAASAAIPFTVPVRTSTPSLATSTSVTVSPTNLVRKYLVIQNNSLANICCSISGGVLTGVTPTATNKCIVISPGGYFENNSNVIPQDAVTCYQTSGGTINTVVILEG